MLAFSKHGEVSTCQLYSNTHANATADGIRAELLKAGITAQLLSVLKIQDTDLQACAAQLLIELASYGRHLIHLTVHYSIRCR